MKTDEYFYDNTKCGYCDRIITKKIFDKQEVVTVETSHSLNSQTGMYDEMWKFKFCSFECFARGMIEFTNELKRIYLKKEEK